ncbi:hypothetical protein FACS1894179_04330 [Bacteroidia bacterium]|nr:hypothetical protein FACS1894169_12420 [Bacteroidia bacterium]GHV39424.1 hypothetical protein FACS1894179_04330 [Bacteroidia bacterium]
MNLRQSHRKQAKIKLALEGCSGSGKTYSSLLLAYGMTNDWTKIAIIDTENGSADLYAHLGQYNVLTLQAPFTPEKYIEAITVCENAGMEVIIIDSISHCWEYLLEYHASLQGYNTFANWQKVTPRQNTFIQKILSSTSHVISTMRTKQDYILTEKNGKTVPEKIGLKAVMRDGVDYEFTIVFDVDIKHYSTASKDRTGLFMGKPEFTITPDTGKRILQWCNGGTSIESVKVEINNAKTEEELYALYHKYPEWREQLTPDFMRMKQSIQSAKTSDVPTTNNQPITNNPNFIRYGNNISTIASQK